MYNVQCIPSSPSGGRCAGEIFSPRSEHTGQSAGWLNLLYYGLFLNVFFIIQIHTYKVRYNSGNGEKRLEVR